MKTSLLHSFILLFFITANIFPQTTVPKLTINEFLASNASNAMDPDFKEYSDWIEIYNAGEATVNLRDYSLTDNLSKPGKWRIKTDITLAPKAFLVIWADNRDTTVHASFQLSAGGEQIGLFDPSGAAVDTLTFAAQQTDISYGRYVDGTNNWRFFKSPTPGAANIIPDTGSVSINDPMFSLNSGFYSGRQTLTLSTDNTAGFVRYTLDGSVPSVSSPVYTKPIVLDSTTVVRAQACRTDQLGGNIVTRTFFINESSTLPVVSLVSDPKNLWDDMTGIYVEGKNGIEGYCSTTPKNWNQDWERPVSIEYYDENKQLGFQLNAGMKIGGECTRKYPQKPLAIYARSIYGSGKINYRLFASKNIESLNNIVFSNAGQDWYRAMFRDCLVQNIIQGQMDIDYLAYKPSVVFINGEYWGIHHIREKHNEHYIEANYGIDPDKIDILSNNQEVNEGSGEHYKRMMDFVSASDLTLPANYDSVKKQMDIDEYINYMVTEIFFSNADWPGGNTKYWREQGEGNKWRWIIYDTDLGFGAHPMSQYNTNTLTNVLSPTSTYYANPSWSTLLFRKLMTNTDFKNQFAQRFIASVQTVFKAERMLGIIDSLSALLAPEIPRHLQRWPLSVSYSKGADSKTDWNVGVNIIKEFARKRSLYIMNYLSSTLGLSGSATLKLRTIHPEGGKVMLESMKMPDSTDIAFYKNIPVRCVADPKKGYRFIGWEGISTSKEDTISVVITGTAQLTAVFEPKIVSVENDQPGNMPSHFELMQNYPNPFNPSTVIRFQMPASARVSLKVYDILGSEVSTLIDQEMPAGYHSVTFDASGLTSGIYIYRIGAGHFSQSRKMVIVK
ncbi:MAG: CotH kinase family protein [Bacteroidota bacterium]